MNVIQAITTYIANAISTLWSALLSFGLAALKWFATFVVDLGVFIINAFFEGLKWASEILPNKFELPKLPPAPEIFQNVNYFFPLSEAVLLFGGWAVVLTVIGAIKLARFLRVIG